MRILLAFLALLFIIFGSACGSKIDDPLIIPPKFTELPDLKNPEPETTKNPQEIEKLRELLIEENN